jgi:hypothetical protein
MKRSGIWLVFIVAAGAGTFGYWQLRRGREGVSKTSLAAVDLAAQLEGLRSEVMTLRKESRSAASMAALAVTASERGTSEKPHAAPSGSAAPDGERGVEWNARAREQERSALARRLAGEPVDRFWSHDAETNIRDVIQLPQIHGELTDVKCGSTLCRAVVEFASDTDQHNFARNVAREKPFAPGAEYYYESVGDRYVTTVYAVREGQDLAELLKD